MDPRLILHQTHHTIADLEGVAAHLQQSLQGQALHLFPELFLTGYPLQDIVLQRPFIEAYLRLERTLDAWALEQEGQVWRALFGGLEYELEASLIPKNIFNVICELVPGVGLRKIYRKRLLPNYDIFDEQKYFSPGEKNCFYDYQGRTFGLQICEDMWSSSFHDLDPCDLMLSEAQERGLQLSGIINLSASPFEAGKTRKRLERATNLSMLFKCPFVYVNRVGGEDEVLFDGTSFVVAGRSQILRMAAFEAQRAEITISKDLGFYEGVPEFRPGNTWEGLFSPALDQGPRPPQLQRWSDEVCEEVLAALQFGIQEYARKSGFRRFLVALSGGIDSALVLTIVKLSLGPGQEVEAVYMPSIHSSRLSTSLSEEICRKLGVKFSYLPIKFLHAAVRNSFTQTFPEPFQGLTDENVQSRLRGLLLYTRSNQTGAMVLNTSNKSELAVGYSTQYGDSVGALSLLGDLYKSEVFRLARYINERYDTLIPEAIITRGPSAELRENQLDEDSLPPYPRLDAMLEGLLSYRLGGKQLVELGFAPEEVERVLRLHHQTEYKRAQFCPIIKIKAKSFGFGYRMPISKNTHYHQW